MPAAQEWRSAQPAVSVSTADSLAESLSGVQTWRSLVYLGRLRAGEERRLSSRVGRHARQDEPAEPLVPGSYLSWH